MTDYSLYGARCPACGNGIRSDDVIQHMPYYLGAAVRALWQAAAGDENLAVLHEVAEHVQREIARRATEQERIRTTEARQLPLLGEQDLAAFQEEQAIATALAPETEADRLPSAAARMAWARRDCEPVTFMISLGNRTSVLKVDGDLKAGMVTDAVATKMPFGLPEGCYTLAYSDAGQLRAVSRDVKISDLAGEEGHESRRYIILTCT